MYREGFSKGIENILSDPVAWSTILPVKVWYLWIRTSVAWPHIYCRNTINRIWGG